MQRPRHPPHDLPAMGCDRVDALPHGCIPDGGRVDDATAMRWVLTSLEIGGHDDFVPRVRDMLEAVLTDPAAAALLSRFLRGDRSGVSELHQRLIDAAPLTRGSD